MNDIKCNISDFLNKKGMTQRELADAVGTTEVSISRYVSGERMPKATTCIQIAKVLGCNVEDLYTLQSKEENRGMTEQEYKELTAALNYSGIPCDMKKKLQRLIDKEFIENEEKQYD